MKLVQVLVRIPSGHMNRLKRYRTKRGESIAKQIRDAVGQLPQVQDKKP